MSIVITGKRKKKQFNKKFKEDILKINLSDKKLTEIDLSNFEQFYKLITINLSKNKIESINLSPLQYCKTLIGLDLRANPLSSVNLAPLKKCYRLERVQFPSNTKIEWIADTFNIFDLPSGLKPYKNQIEESHKAYIRGEAKIKQQLAQEQAPEKITTFLNQFRPGVPVSLSRIASLAEIPEETTKGIILEIIEHMPDVGEFLELEQVFIRKTEAEIQIDSLLDQFRDW